jgi:hypothetical protein
MDEIIMEYEFNAVIEIVGINPFVSVPEDVLEKIFEQAGKNKGPLPVTGTINNNPYKQTLVKFKGLWRFYINTAMLKNSPRRIGETITLTIAFDPDKRTIEPHSTLLAALEQNSEAKKVFEGLPPSRKHEIVRYISFLKSEESIDRNVRKAIDFLLGKGRFVGRDKL